MKRFVYAVVGMFVLAWSMVCYAQPYKILEEQEKMMETMREYCNGLQYKRRNAESSGYWRELVNTSKSFADACSGIEDRFLISKAFEDMSYGLMMLNDPRQALRWAQACLDSNAMAVGCSARKAEILWLTGKP